MKIRSLFPTRIGEMEPLSADEIADLEQAIWMLEDGDTAGHEWCEREGYSGYTSYASLNDLPERATAFGNLKTKLDKWAGAFAVEHGWDLSELSLSLDAMWVNILGEEGSHSGHIHPGSVISGTTYISIPDGAGALKFEDPRLTQLMAAPPLINAPAASQKRFVYTTPTPGMTLMWESWLRHEVIANRSEQPRLSISFNYSVNK